MMYGELEYFVYQNDVIFWKLIYTYTKRVFDIGIDTNKTNFD